jgi:hypothetical protein
MNNKDIANSVMDHFDHACYGLRCILALYLYVMISYLILSSVFTVCCHCKEWGLESTRRQKHTVESIGAAVGEIKKRFPNCGAKRIQKALLLENNIRVPRCVPHSAYDY